MRSTPPLVLASTSISARRQSTMTQRKSRVLMSSKVSLGERMPKREMSEEQRVRSERADWSRFCRCERVMSWVRCGRASLKSRGSSLEWLDDWVNLRRKRL